MSVRFLLPKNFGHVKLWQDQHQSYLTEPTAIATQNQTNGKKWTKGCSNILVQWKIQMVGI